MTYPRALSRLMILALSVQALAPTLALAKGDGPVTIAFPFPYMDTNPPPHFTPSGKDPSVTKYRTWYTGNDSRTLEEIRAVSPALAQPKSDTSKPAINYVTGKGAEAKTLATFRPGVFGNQSQSELAYFHLSRILGTGGIPAATYQTMEKKEFNRLADSALKQLAGKTDQKSLEAKTNWENAKLAVAKGDSSVAVPGQPNLIYGSLADKTRGEVPLKGADGKELASAGDLRAQPFFKAVASSDDVEKSLAGLKAKDPKAYQKAIQELALARDTASQLLLDGLLAQGNDFEGMLVKKQDHFVDKIGKLTWKSDPDLRDLEGASAPIQLDRGVEKDPEDALKWRATGSPRSALVREIRHMDPIVYDRLQWLAGLLRDDAKEPALRKYFTESAHLTAENYQAIKGRIQQYATHFKGLKESGALKIDLDLEKHFVAGNPRRVEQKVEAPLNLDPNAAPSDLVAPMAQ